MMKLFFTLGLLVGLSVSCAIPLHAQPMSVVQYQGNSAKDARKQQKLTRKNAKQQRKIEKRAAKAQQKQLKAAQKADAKANRQLRQAASQPD